MDIFSEMLNLVNHGTMSFSCPVDDLPDKVLDHLGHYVFRFKIEQEGLKGIKYAKQTL